MSTLKIVDGVSELRTDIASWRRAGLRIGLVPTMGALHEGHLSLVRETQKRADKVIVSIFVNPAQFAPNEDFNRYPRTLESDVAKLARVEPDLVFTPSEEEMYPLGFATSLNVGGPGEGLETDIRPHFFGGVATVVSKLLIAAMPDLATFGEKDYQQLLVVRRMVIDLGLATEIFGAPIMREADGLAMSSRNAYLNEGERRTARHLNQVLKAVAERAKAGDGIAAAERFGVDNLLRVGFDAVDYVGLRDAQTLQKIDSLRRPTRVLAAAKIGRTRLIDNMAV